jgi:hypothetical protein
MKAKSLEWLKRYGPAEISGTIAAYLGFLLVNHTLQNPIAAAFAGAWAENLGFYSVILYRKLKEPTYAQAKLRSLFEILTEFGPSEVLDSFFLRPLCLTFGVKFLGEGVGIFVGKVLGDVLFYMPVIATYELRKWRAARRESVRLTLTKSPDAI